MERIKEIGLIAVIRAPSDDLALNTINALIKGGVRGIEVTYSVPHACVVLENLVKKYGNEVLFGMGTITRLEQIKAAKESGARFLVSPMFDDQIAERMTASGLIAMIGAFTPSEVFHAYNKGADIINIFPGRLAGPNHIKDLRGPFPDIPFMPTGGVEMSNLAEWFKAGVLAVGAGSNLCPGELMKKGQFEEISRIAREFVAAVESIIRK